MKSALGAGALLLAIVCLSLFEINYMERTVDALLTQVAQISENHQNPAVLEEIDRLEEAWQKHEGVFCTVMRHNELNEIGLVIKRMRILSADGQEAAFLLEAERLRGLLGQIRDGERVHIRNLL